MNQTRLADRQTVQIAGRALQVSHLNRVLWPDIGWTKADLMEYFIEAAPYLLPHLKNRPLTVVRHPTGVGGESFFQKRCPAHAPDWIPTHWVPPAEPGEEGIPYILAHDIPTLIWLANQNAIDLHPWLAPAESPDYPSVTVIDIDPMPPTGFAEARRVALSVKRVLEALGLQGFPKLSGATGIHIYIPLDGKTTFERSRSFAEWMSSLLARHYPNEVTNIRAVRRRGARVYVDPLQNLRHKTIAAPYSPRGRPGGRVSAPVTWAELPDVSPPDFTLKSIPARLKKLGDLMAPLRTLKQTLPDPSQLPPQLNV